MVKNIVIIWQLQRKKHIKDLQALVLGLNYKNVQQFEFQMVKDNVQL